MFHHRTICLSIASNHVVLSNSDPSLDIMNINFVDAIVLKLNSSNYTISVPDGDADFKEEFRFHRLFLTPTCHECSTFLLMES
jgi:hypothetical protein